MGSLTRIRAHAGLWLVVAALGAAVVAVAAGAGPASTRVADTALRQLVGAAPSADRDIIASLPHDFGGPPLSPGGLALRVRAGLPPELRDVEEVSWAYQRTGVSVFQGVGATLTGAGVVSAPSRFAPVVSFHHQPDLSEEVTLVEGREPATDPDEGVVEVMVGVEVAAALGLRVGHEYTLHPGVLVNTPAAEPGPSSLPVRVVGVFEARDQAAPVWQHASPLLRPGSTTIPFDTPPQTTQTAVLVTDGATIPLLDREQLLVHFVPETVVRVRLAADQLHAAWVPAGRAAVARAATSTELVDLKVRTGLLGLLDEFQRQWATVRAVVAVAAAGIVGTLAGLLLLAARLIADRRRAELALLRARGGSTAGVAGRLLAEAGWAVLPAVVGAWLLCRWALAAPALPAIDVAPAAGGALVALLIVPVVGGVVAGRSRALPARPDLAVRRAGPARWTLEVSVVVLAGLGVVLVYRRGLSLAGVDPYLSAVPVLLAVSAGLVALRLYPWPLRALAAVARRLRGAVGFVALARSGRAAPGAALALLVLVLAVAVGGFAGTVNAGVAQARDRASVQQVGAHVRVAAATLPPEAVAAAAAVPGVEVVAAADHGGRLVNPATRNSLAVTVIAVDTPAYQEVLAALGVAVELPPELVSAQSGDGPVPLLAPPSVARRDRLVLRVGDAELPVQVVGDLAGLPLLTRDPGWVLLPRQALAAPGAVDELLVGGAGADPQAVHDAVAAVAAEDVTTTSLAGHRARLEASGFNDGLTIVFVAGTAGGLAGGVLAVALALVGQARARGRVLSLLRTMGLSGAQARGLLLVELLPLTGLAVAVGAAVGIGMPLLLAPALGLGAFTGGVPLSVGIDPGTVAVLGGVVVALVVAGVVVEAAVNRRLGLGRVLRVE